MPAAILMSALAALVMQAAAPVPVPAAAAEPAGQPGMQPPVGKDPKEIVCKRVEVTGSRMAKRDCRSRAAWDELTDSSRRLAESMTNANTMTQFDAAPRAGK